MRMRIACLDTASHESDVAADNGCLAVFHAQDAVPKGTRQGRCRAPCRTICCCWARPPLEQHPALRPCTAAAAEVRYTLQRTCHLHQRFETTQPPGGSAPAAAHSVLCAPASQPLHRSHPATAAEPQTAADAAENHVCIRHLNHVCTVQLG